MDGRSKHCKGSFQRRDHSAAQTGCWGDTDAPKAISTQNLDVSVQFTWHCVPVQAVSLHTNPYGWGQWGHWRRLQWGMRGIWLKGRNVRIRPFFPLPQSVPHSLPYFISCAPKALCIKFKSRAENKSKATHQNALKLHCFITRQKMTSKTWTKQTPGVKKME